MTMMKIPTRFSQATLLYLIVASLLPQVAQTRRFGGSWSLPTTTRVGGQTTFLPVHRHNNNDGGGWYSPSSQRKFKTSSIALLRELKGGAEGAAVPSVESVTQNETTNDSDSNHAADSTSVSEEISRGGGVTAVQKRKATADEEHASADQDSSSEINDGADDSTVVSISHEVSPSLNNTDTDSQNLTSTAVQDVKALEEEETPEKRNFLSKLLKFPGGKKKDKFHKKIAKKLRVSLVNFPLECAQFFMPVYDSARTSSFLLFCRIATLVTCVEKSCTLPLEFALLD